MSDCIESTRTPSKDRPRITVNGKQWVEARWVWTQAYGAIPPGGFVCHTCDNRRCVNLEHLYLGTALTNYRDAVERRRFPQLERQRCRQGHPLDGLQRSTKGQPSRYCKTCHRDRERERVTRDRSSA